ncbi:hypothetical protein ACS0TY_019763 [Phlomoides rotata]
MLGIHFGERAIEWPKSCGCPMRRDLPFRWSRAPEDEVIEVPSQEDEHKAFQDSLEDYSWIVN